jgi:hypothetical protein
MGRSALVDLPTAEHAAVQEVIMKYSTSVTDDEFDDALFDATNLIRAQVRRLVPHIDVGEVDRSRPLREEAELSTDEWVALLLGADAAGVSSPAEAVDAEASLTDLARAVVSRLTSRWTVTVRFECDD